MPSTRSGSLRQRWLVELYAVAVTLEESVRIRVTEFVDSEGELRAVTIRILGRTTWSAADHQIESTGGSNIALDFLNGTEKVTGNPCNGHVPGERIVINDSGRIVFDLETGDLHAVNGPHEAFFGDFDDFCGVLEG
ncbi:MAG TPA: hypothetical protein VLB85_02310 [Acidimicrobiia bacterium]|nr:hypothetical protein [Acidimicrobiia bacterium]